MRPIHQNVVIQIEVTNGCYLSCQNCTRHVGHHRNVFHMDVDFARKAIESVLDSPCRIGLMGGEPSIHPQFGKLLELWRELVPIERREYWTAGLHWDLWKEEIQNTFSPLGS